MEYRILGKTGLKVSEIGLGASELGRPEVSEEQAERVLNTALDLGVNFIDTAAMYKLSEDRIGRYLKNRRDDFIIATKCGDYNIIENDSFRTVKDYSPGGIMKTIEMSRAKLKTDVIDIVQFHGLPASGDERFRAFDALLKAREKGWVKFVGVSIDELLSDRETEAFPLDTQEFTYNILEQKSALSLMPALSQSKTGIIIKRPIANAVFLLDKRPEGTYYASSWDRDRKFNTRDLAGDMDPVEFALRFSLSHPDVHTAIVGTTNPKNLERNVYASDGEGLPPDTIEAIENRFREVFGG